MKRLLRAIAIGFTLMLSMIFFVAAGSPARYDNVAELTKIEVVNHVKQYAPFTLYGKTIRLFPEAALTQEQGIALYPNAYAYIVAEFEASGVSSDLDQEEFQENVKKFFLIELDDKDLEREILAFVRFMDYYENKADNQRIFAALANPFVTSQTLKELMPASSLSTQPFDSQGGLKKLSNSLVTYGGQLNLQSTPSKSP